MLIKYVNEIQTKTGTRSVGDCCFTKTSLTAQNWKISCKKNIKVRNFSVHNSHDKHQNFLGTSRSRKRKKPRKKRLESSTNGALLLPNNWAINKKFIVGSFRARRCFASAEKMNILWLSRTKDCVSVFNQSADDRHVANNFDPISLLENSLGQHSQADRLDLINTYGDPLSSLWWGFVAFSWPTEAENRFQTAANKIMISQHRRSTPVNAPIRLSDACNWLVTGRWFSQHLLARCRPWVDSNFKNLNRVVCQTNFL